jgi:hypothetical protein
METHFTSGINDDARRQNGPGSWNEAKSRLCEQCPLKIAAIAAANKISRRKKD